SASLPFRRGRRPALGARGGGALALAGRAEDFARDEAGGRQPRGSSPAGGRTTCSLGVRLFAVGAPAGDPRAGYAGPEGSAARPGPGGQADGAALLEPASGDRESAIDAPRSRRSRGA